MAIPLGSSANYFGTPVSVAGGIGPAVTATNFGVAATPWTNTNNAIAANMVLSANFAAAPTGYIELYVKLIGISGGDSPQPSATFAGIYCGAFQMETSTSAQNIPLDISLPNAVDDQQYQFSIKNSTDNTLPVNWDLTISDKFIGPKV